MAQTVAVVRNTLSSTVSGAVSFTSSGFGTPAAAIIITCGANSTNNPQDNADLSVGFWDGTNQYAVGVRCIDGGASAVTDRGSAAYGALVPSTAYAYYTVSPTTDGITLTLSSGTTSIARFATVILLAGVSASAFTLTANSTVNNTTTKTGLAFTPNLVLFIGSGLGNFSTSSSSAGIFTFGVAESGGDQRMVSFGSVHAASDEIATQLYSETRVAGQIYNDTETWTGEVTSWTSDGFVLTTRTGGSGGDVVACLALGGADLSYEIGTLTTPTSTASPQTVSTSVAPDALVLALSTATGTSLETGSGANGLMLGMADDNGEFAHNISVEDAAAAMNTASASSASALVNLDSSSGGSRTDMIDGTVALNSSDFTITYSAVDGTARKGWWLAFGVAAAGGTANPWYYRLQQGVAA